MVMNYRTAILVTLACGTFVCVVLIGSLAGMKTPDKSDLVAVAGRVVSVETITPKTENIRFQLDSSPSEFRYIEHLPNFQTVRSRVTQGRPITVYVDKASVDDPGTVEVWGIATGGDSWLVTYEALAEYRRSNRGIALILLPIFLLATIGAGVAAWFEFRPR